jgi:hypothetical protein
MSGLIGLEDGRRVRGRYLGQRQTVQRPLMRDERKSWSSPASQEEQGGISGKGLHYVPVVFQTKSALLDEMLAQPVIPYFDNLERLAVAFRAILGPLKHVIKMTVPWFIVDDCYHLVRTFIRCVESVTSPDFEGNENAA